MGSRDLLVALDLAEGGATVLLEAKTWLANADGTLHVVQAVPLPAHVDTDVLRNPQAHPWRANELKTAEAEVLTALQVLVSSIAPHATCHTRTGPPAAVVLTLAAELNVGAIAVGSHGREGLTRVFQGSVAEAIARRATCPVLVVPTRATTLEETA
jgi:nucleotide-binding universal stress UspA family protein